MTSPPLSLYVHLPWCVKKCPYCDFNSYSLGQADPRSRYLDALTRDLALEAARVPDRPLTSIFLGGGTPSLFSPAEIGRRALTGFQSARSHFLLRHCRCLAVYIRAMTSCGRSVRRGMPASSK